MNVTDYMKLPYTRLVQEVNDESGLIFMAGYWNLMAAKVQEIH